MSDQKKVTKPVEGNVAQMGASQCKFEGCKHKPEQFGFCKPHYELYMAGVVRGDGKKPIDYEQKLSHYNHSKKAA